VGGIALFHADKAAPTSCGVIERKTQWEPSMWNRASGRGPNRPVPLLRLCQAALVARKLLAGEPRLIMRERPNDLRGCSRLTWSCANAAFAAILDLVITRACEPWAWQLANCPWRSPYDIRLREAHCSERLHKTRLPARHGVLLQAVFASLMHR
jgi:hypothetical protein